MINSGNVYPPLTSFVRLFLLISGKIYLLPPKAISYARKVVRNATST